MLTAQQIVALANQAAKTPGMTTQAGQKLNVILQELCMTYDIAQTRKTVNINFQVSVTGPYLLPPDYLRTQNGKQFYLYNGQPYFMTDIDQWEYDALIQQPGFMDFPRNFFVDTSTSLSFPPNVPGGFSSGFSSGFQLGFTPNGTQAQEFVWPPPSISVPVTIHYFSMMPDISSPEVSNLVPWFPYQQYLITRLTGEMMSLADDTRAADFLTDQESRNPQGAAVLLRRYLTMKDDPEGRAKTVELDRRRFGMSKWNALPNTKTIGWLFAVGLLLQAFLSGVANAQLTPAQLIAEINANFPDNTTGFITPALARKTLIDMVNSMATQVANPTPAATLGMKCDGMTDDTAALATANTALPKGGVVRIPDGAQCIIVGAVTFTVNGLFIVGGGYGNVTTNGSTITCTTATTANCLSWSGSTFGGGLVSLRLDASVRTGTACAISATGSAHLLFQHLYVAHNNGWCLTSTNTIILDDVTGSGPALGSGKWAVNWIGTLTARSDALFIQNSVFNLNSGGADCILWDGLANTMTLQGVHCLNNAYGIHTTNVNGNASNYPAFLWAGDFENDGGTLAAIRIDAGGYYRCVHCDLFHSTNDVGVIINGDVGSTIVRSVVFEGGRIGNSGKQCVTTAAQGVRFVNVDFGSCSLNGSGLFAAIEVQATAVDTQIVAGSVVDFGDGNLASPGILLDNGSSRTLVLGIDLHYPTTALTDNSTGQDNLWLPFVGQSSFLSFGKSAGAGQLGYFYQANSGSATTVRVENPRTATSTSARFEMATGTASSFSDLALTDGATPQVSLTTGSGVTGGINVDASAAVAGNVALKTASGQAVVLTSAVPLLSMQAVVMASLPTCAAGTAGWRATVSNGTGTPPAAFDTAITIATPGTVFAPVFCDGTSWRYG